MTLSRQRDWWTRLEYWALWSGMKSAFDMSLKQEEINIDNLGSIESMADYVLKRKSG